MRLNQLSVLLVASRLFNCLKFLCMRRLCQLFVCCRLVSGQWRLRIVSCRLHQLPVVAGVPRLPSGACTCRGHMCASRQLPSTHYLLLMRAIFRLTSQFYDYDFSNLYSHPSFLSSRLIDIAEHRSLVWTKLCYVLELVDVPILPIWLLCFHGKLYVDIFVAFYPAAPGRFTLTSIRSLVARVCIFSRLFSTAQVTRMLPMFLHILMMIHRAALAFCLSLVPSSFLSSVDSSFCGGGSNCSRNRLWSPVSNQRRRALSATPVPCKWLPRRFLRQSPVWQCMMLTW